jgi:hypothetical protein
MKGEFLLKKTPALMLSGVIIVLAPQYNRKTFRSVQYGAKKQRKSAKTWRCSGDIRIMARL